MHAGASAQTEIARRKSAMENLPLYREKNEVAGMEVVVGVLNTEAGEVQEEGENARASERKWSSFTRQHKSEETHFCKSF